MGFMAVALLKCFHYHLHVKVNDIADTATEYE